MVRFFLKYVFAFSILIVSHTSVCAAQYDAELNIVKQYYINKTPPKTPEETKKIQDIIKKNQSHADFNYALGEFLLDIGYSLDAEVIFKKLYENHPTDKYEIAYGKALLAQEKSEDILQVVHLNGLSVALKAQKYFLHASAHYHLKRYDNGLKHINTALLLDKNIPVFVLLKARLLAALGKIVESMSLIDIIPNINKTASQKINLVEVDILRAENYINTKDYLKALELYNIAIAKEPQNLVAYAGRGMTHLELKNFDDAFQDALFLAQNDPGNYHAIFIIGKVFNHKKKFQQALDIYDGMNTDGYLPNLLSYAEINFNAKNYEKARILLNKYLRQDFENPAALKLRGILKLREGNTRDALGDLEIAYKLTQQDPYILIALAQAHYDLGHFNKAEYFYSELKDNFPQLEEITKIAFELSCKLKPNYHNKIKNLCNDSMQSAISEQVFEALQFMYLGYREYALDEMEKIVRIYPSNLTVIKNYVRVLKYTDDIDEAARILLKILNKSPNDTDILSELNTIYGTGKSSIDIFNEMNVLFIKNKKSVNIGYYLANFYYKNKNYTKALQITNEMIKRNVNHFKPVDLYEMVLKIMIHRPDKFTKEITFYLKKYLALEDKNHLLIRLLRKNIMQSNFKHSDFRILDIPADEKTAKDYQIYAEYLIFIHAPEAAKVIYQNGMNKFSDDFDLFQSAFNFHTNPSDLLVFKNKFASLNPDYQTFLQAKLYLSNGQKQEAISILEKQFKVNYSGIIADLLLQINPDDAIISLINDNIKKITEHHYEASYQLAKALHKKYRFSEASNLLMPYLNQRKNDFDYKLCLAQSTFHSNFKMSHNLIKELMSQHPNNNDFLIEYIAYEVKNKNYKNAIYLFEKHQPKQHYYSHIHYYYANALLNTNKKVQALAILKKLLTGKQEFFEKNDAQKWLLQLQSERKP